jgi:aerobic-type carbon monoxide dehydrogenase small subunit (CoxS/CutS family)
MSKEENEINKNMNNSKGISRREFLKDAGLIVGGATVGSMAILSACDNGGGVDTKTITSTVTAPGTTITKTVTITSPVTPADTTSTNVINMTVYGDAVQLYIEPNWTLRDALRERLNLLSIKDMCNGYGACGSCTVIMDSRPVLSCMALAVECEGAVIETAEYLGYTQHPLVNTYASNFCAQCGYCTPGFIVTAKALLDRKSNPDEEDIREALAGNLCRCGTYPQHIIAVNEAATILKGEK